MMFSIQTMQLFLQTRHAGSVAVAARDAVEDGDSSYYRFGYVSCDHSLRFQLGFSLRRVASGLRGSPVDTSTEAGNMWQLHRLVFQLYAGVLEVATAEFLLRGLQTRKFSAADFCAAHAVHPVLDLQQLTSEQAADLLRWLSQSLPMESQLQTALDCSALQLAAGSRIRQLFSGNALRAYTLPHSGCMQ